MKTAKRERMKWTNIYRQTEKMTCRKTVCKHKDKNKSQEDEKNRGLQEKVTWSWKDRKIERKERKKRKKEKEWLRTRLSIKRENKTETINTVQIVLNKYFYFLNTYFLPRECFLNTKLKNISTKLTFHLVITESNNYIWSTVRLR